VGMGGGLGGGESASGWEGAGVEGGTAGAVC